jgi:dTDP-glucose 4,6-dehydratase/UDP-glucose 4-epimerase
MSRGNPERLAGLPCQIWRGDIRDEIAVSSAVHGCDTIIHAAYRQGTASFYEEPRLVLDVALRGMLNLLSACERHGVGDLMLISSSEAYQVASIVPTPETIPLTVPDVLNPRFSYGGGKIACEIMGNAWQRTGVLDRFVITRAHNVVGPDMGNEHVIPEFCHRMNRLVREHPTGIIEFPIQGSGQETRSFCAIEDGTDQFVLLLEKAEPLSVYHVGNMDERTIADVAHAVAACYGRQVKVVPGTLPKGSPTRRLPDTAKIQALGYSPKVSFEECLTRTVAWYQAHPVPGSLAA